MTTVRGGDPVFMAAWLRRLADFVERADGAVTVTMGSIEYGIADVTAWGDTFRQYVHTGEWTATMEIQGTGGFQPPTPPPEKTLPAAPKRLRP